MKKIFAVLKRELIRILIIVISVVIFLGIIFFFRWVGLKGVLGFAFGVLVTGFIFMSNHPFIMVYREMILK